MNDFNWEDLKYFIELVRTRSPAEAGRRLKADHTTVRRRVATLEDALGTRLFATRGQGYELTVKGEQLLNYAIAMEGLAGRAREGILDSDMEVAGSVRIGTPEGLGSFFLGARMGMLAAALPKLRLHLVVLPRILNLSSREADLAVAYSPPEQLRQIVRKLTDYKLYIYGSKTYLEKHEPIRQMSDLTRHNFIGYIPDLIYAPQLDYLAELPEKTVAKFEATGMVAQTRAVLAGAGLCILPSFAAAVEPDLTPVLPEQFSVTRQFWLIIHPESINLARVRTVIDQLSDMIRSERELFLSPRPPHRIGDAPLGRETL